MKKLILFIFIIVLTIKIIYAQNINFQVLKTLKKDSLIKLGQIKLKEQGIFLNPIDLSKIRVMANSKILYLIFSTEFNYLDESKVLKNYDIKVEFSENGVKIYPNDYNRKSQKYIITKSQMEIIKLFFIDDTIPFAEDKNVEIEIKKDYYQMIETSKKNGGVVCYNIDKKAKKKHMKWHEHPSSKMQIYNVNEIEEFLEIK